MSDRFLDTPSQHHRLSLLDISERACHRLFEGVFRLAGSPAAKLAEAAVTRALRKISIGQLRIVTPGTTYCFPEEFEDEPELQAEIVVRVDTFWLRLATMGDLGFAEAYMYGEIDCDDLISVFKVFLHNQKNLQSFDSPPSFLARLPQKITSMRFVNNLSNSRSNISAHYDISNKMFQAFLSEDMTYSCAIFKNPDSDLKEQQYHGLQLLSLDKVQMKHGLPTPQPSSTPSPSKKAFSIMEEADDLHAAQMRKLDYIILCANIRPGQRILEIGSGWGSMAIRIATQFPDTTVDTITLSVHQQSLARERIADAGKDVQDRIKVHLMDYRCMPTEWAGTFDRVISIEMVEHVAPEYYEEYFRVIDWALKPDVGAGFVMSSTIPEERFERYTTEIDFVRKWIFPGGVLPTATELIRALNAGSRGRLVLDSVTNCGPHYPRTLREWKRRFLENFDETIEPALREEHPEAMTGARGKKEAEVFKRKWNYFFCYCEIGFTNRLLGDHMITFTRQGNNSFRSSPLQ